MSHYTTVEIKTDKLDLSKEAIQYLQGVTGTGWHKFEGKKIVLEPNSIEYHKAFNHNHDQAIEVLREIEKSVKPEKIAYEIGDIYSETFWSKTFSIFAYDGKIYLLNSESESGMCYYFYRYTIKDLLGNTHQICENEEIENKEELFEKFISNRS